MKDPKKPWPELPFPISDLSTADDKPEVYKFMVAFTIALGEEVADAAAALLPGEDPAAVRVFVRQYDWWRFNSWRHNVPRTARWAAQKYLKALGRDDEAEAITTLRLVRD